MSLKDDLWIWGQTAGTHHAHNNNSWKLPGENKMETLEGAKFLGTPNIIRVAMAGSPTPPFDDEAELFKDQPKVVWSVVGDASTERTNTGGTDTAAVIDISRKYKNIIGGIMDDIFVKDRLENYTPEIIEACAKELHDANLELWSVIYEYNMEMDVASRLAPCDAITLWTWKGDQLINLEQTYENLKKLMLPHHKVYAGCYFWDYGNRRPLPMGLMKYQLEVYRKWYDEGKIEGIIMLSNCTADIGLETVDYVRQWIAEL
ncbi:MAG: hypothetical protein E7328_05835 [Clostridiales bacterium]|nr:hypothetical protein [Clostridiales bacterium]